jgi:acyl carrier protein
MIQRRTREKSAQIFKSKIQGTLVLDRLLQLMKKKPRFFLLCSSVTSILPMMGQVGYSAANAFLDAFAHYRNISGHDSNHMLTVSVNWDRWRSIGIANILETQHKELTGRDLAGGITSREGAETFRRILANTQPQVVVSPHDMGILFEKAHSVKAPSLIKGLEETVVPARVLPRPQLDSEYTPPGNETEEILANLWAEFFGYEKIGTRDDFFELGGDSLKAMVVLSRIHKKFDVEIPINEIFTRPTIAKLSPYINSANKSTYFTIEPAEKKEYYALSSTQKGLYAQQEIAPGSTAYNEFTAVTIEEDVDTDRLIRCFKTLIRRHESLRTSFIMFGENPAQRIHDQVEFDIEYYQVEVEVKIKVGEIINQFIRPFDLSRAPLFRVALLKTTPHRHILLIDLHHLIFDKRSFDIFIDELTQLYEGKALPQPDLRYKDFSEWQNRFLREEKKILNRQKEYWLNKFADRIPVLDLPFDYPRPQVQTFEGKQMTFQLDSTQTTALKELALREKVTLFMVLLGIYTVFLSRLSGQEDIVIGSPLVGRNHPDLQSIIGMFVNMVVFRNFSPGEKTFLQFLKELKETTMEALENQGYPFEELVEQLGIRRDASRNPLFNVTFAMLNTEISRDRETKPSRIKGYSVEQRMSKFDLGLEALETNEKLFLTFLYRIKLFRTQTIKRYSNYLKEIISVVLKNKNIRLKDISIAYDLVEPETIIPKAEFRF